MCGIHREEDARKIYNKLSGDLKSFALSRSSVDQSRGGPLRRGPAQLSNLMFGSRQGNVEVSFGVNYNSIDHWDNYITAPEPDIRATDRQRGRGSQVQQTLQRCEEAAHRGNNEETQVRETEIEI